MNVAVVGGTGVLGAPLVAELAARGDDVLVLSRKPPRELPAGASHRGVDLTDGKGLDEALAGVEVVLDASNANPRNAGPRAGVRHHVGISIVGCDRVPTSYYKVKAMQEEAIGAAANREWNWVARS